MKRGEVRPALKPDEWKQRRHGVPSGDGRPATGVAHARGDREPAAGRCSADESFASIALANDALPANDMRKITPRLVELMRNAVVFEGCAGGPPTPDAVGTGELHAFAAVLAALIPPSD